MLSCLTPEPIDGDVERVLLRSDFGSDGIGSG
jgi:hypothetical protein